MSDKNARLLQLSFNAGLSVLLLKKNVLQGQHEADKIWSKEGFYAVVIFLSIFVMIVTCLMVSLLLYLFYPLLSPLLNIIGYICHSHECWKGREQKQDCDPAKLGDRIPDSGVIAEGYLRNYGF